MKAPTPVRGVCLVAALTVCACNERARPADGPFAPEDGARSSVPTLVRFSSPVRGQTFHRSELSGAPGVEVVLTGTFVSGHHLSVEGRFIPYGPVPFFSRRLLVDGAVTSLRMRVHGEPSHFTTAGPARLLVRVFDGGAAPISVDSVTFTVQ